MCLILLCGMLTGTGPATAAEVDVRQASMTVDERTFEFGAYQVDLSANGRYAVFTSSVRTSTGGSAELEQHVYVRDVRTGRTELVSVASDGTPANDGSDSPSISADGRFVVFTSTATSASV